MSNYEGEQPPLSQGNEINWQTLITLFHFFWRCCWGSVYNKHLVLTPPRNTQMQGKLDYIMLASSLVNDFDVCYIVKKPMQIRPGM